MAIRNGIEVGELGQGGPAHKEEEKKMAGKPAVKPVKKGGFCEYHPAVALDEAGVCSVPECPTRDEA